MSKFDELLKLQTGHDSFEEYFKSRQTPFPEALEKVRQMIEEKDPKLNDLSHGNVAELLKNFEVKLNIHLKNVTIEFDDFILRDIPYLYQPSSDDGKILNISDLDTFSSRMSNQIRGKVAKMIMESVSNKECPIKKITVQSLREHKEQLKRSPAPDEGDVRDALYDTNDRLQYWENPRLEIQPKFRGMKISKLDDIELIEVRSMWSFRKTSMMKNVMQKLGLIVDEVTNRIFRNDIDREDRDEDDDDSEDV